MRATNFVNSMIRWINTKSLSLTIFRYIKTTLWSKAGHLNKALSKGAKTTTWIWNLHDYGNDFDTQESSTGLIARKVFSSSHSLYSLIGQDILNSYTSQYFSGITITSGFYQLWRSSGIITQSQLKYACAACLIATHSGICIRHTSCYTSQCISNLNLQTSIATTSKLLNPSTRSIFLAQVAAHHFTTGVVFIILGIIRFFTSQLSILTSYIDYHAELSINLATWASI